MFSYKFLWYIANLNLVQIEHVMEQTVKERIKELIASEGIANSRFEQMCGLSNGYIKGLKRTPGSNKIAGILEDGYLIDSDSKGRDTLTYIRNLNYRLGMFYQNLTSYYARHTGATLAFDLDISDHVIAMGLSHETGKTNTNHFYINNDYRKLDRANRIVIDYVEGRIELD